jgi:two-component system, OmpR family, response regulator MprA
VEPHVLVVDDDRAIRDAVGRALRLHGFTVAAAPDGVEALAALARRPADVVVLDVNMPGVDGFSLTRRLREDGDDTPILLLTARDQVDDRVTGLDVGADDYLVKPFALEELLARLRALLRRAGTGEDGPSVLRVGDLEIRPASMDVRRAGRTLELSPTERELLLVFAEHPDQVLSRDQLVDRVWGTSTEGSNVVDVYVGYLRRKLEAEGEPRLLHTVRGAGYVLRRP